MDKRYALDTNTIFKNPYILDSLSDCDVFISVVVIEELDKYKSDKELGMAARIFSNMLDSLNPATNITETNCRIHFTLPNMVIDYNYLGGYNNDNVIIQTAVDNKATLISGDTNVRIKARNFARIEAIGDAPEFNRDFDLDEYKGYIEHYLEDELVNTLFRLKYLSIDHIKDAKVYPHMFIIVKRFSGKSGDLIAKVNADCTCLEMINSIGNVWGINAKNVEQMMLLHLLMDDDIPLVTVSGKAGTGKTLLALAAGLFFTQDAKDSPYNKLKLTKQNIDMGKDLGALPGDKQEKLAPYMDSYMDALEFIFGGEDEMRSAMAGINNIEMDALNYLRGRTLPGQFFVGDEMQNTRPSEMKTVVTRAGKNSKYVIMGDPNQIDVNYLSTHNNGLVYLIDSFKNEPLAGHITLTHGVRSPLADRAADIL